MFFHNPLEKSTDSTTFGNIILGFQDNDYLLNPEYQREYVWATKEQQELLFSISHGLPLGSIAIITKRIVNNEPYIEIVDGKQRLTTIWKYFNNEFPYICPYTNKEIYYRDLLPEEKRRFKNYCK